MTQEINAANKEMLRLVAQWARSKGIKKPTTSDGMRALLAQFVSELGERALQRAEVVIGAAGDGMVANDPIARMTPPPAILRNSGGMIDIADPETEDSDFTELVRDKQRAMEDAGGDDLAAAVIHRDGAHAAAAAQAPFHNTNPSTAAAAILGGQTTLQPGQNPVEVARWNGNDAETTAVTVTIGQAKLATTRLGQVNFPLQARPYAIVQWGTRGLAMSAFVDALLGTQFSVGASYVSLQMAMQPLSPFPGQTPVAVPMIMGGGLSFQSIERRTPLTYTWYSDTFAADSPNIPIPPFAKTFTFFCDNTAATLDLGAFDIGGMLISTAKTLSGDAALAKTITLPGNAVQLAPNNIVGAPAHVAIVFELSL